jgi:hypothetical protein
MLQNVIPPHLVVLPVAIAIPLDVIPTLAILLALLVDLPILLMPTLVGLENFGVIELVDATTALIVHKVVTIIETPPMHGTLLKNQGLPC